MMKCPRCFKHSTIVEIMLGDKDADQGMTHYCCSNLELELSNPKLQQGTERGCGEYILIKTVKFNKVPLDPWGVPVDTRGYPSR